ncbi:MAG: 2Fe-2S iron-sulfur cluster-binding protein, partial [Chloroflexi bacterium]|nr:2Fe-2S iron-sulfur cluster-binding protein [Chloroflexota bacterium]
MQPIEGLRLSPRPGQLIDRTQPVAFTYNGNAVTAFKGDTVASALFASGITIFSRSFKYHRPRGLLCVSGRCANCLVAVDGVPNVRACTEPVREGMAVRSQNAWPNVNFDLASILDRFDWAMPVGFYYKVFHQPKFLWKLVQPIIRRVGGLGKIDITEDPPHRHQHVNMHADVTVIGGGPAGMSAALAAARDGVRVTLVDEQTTLGGHLRFDSAIHNITSLGKGLTGMDVAQRLAAQVKQAPGIKVLTGASAFGWYSDNLVGVLTA